MGKSDLLIYFPSAVCAGCFLMGYLRKFLKLAPLHEGEAEDGL